VLAVRPEWFTDSIDLGVDDKKMIEQTAGRWIIEIPELRGRRGDVDRIKAFLSRAEDSSRLSYDRFRTDRPRSFLMFGTSNEPQFLIDPTGNRRFWPVICGVVDVEALKRERDQLWAEAAAAEAAGESIRMPRELWEIAGEAQKEAQLENPVYDLLYEALDGMEGKIRAAHVWTIVDIDPARRRQSDNELVGAAMKQLGWTRPKDAIRFKTSPARGYKKGDGQDEITVDREVDRGHVDLHVRQGDPPNVKSSWMVKDGVRQPPEDEKNF
jgi:predicted P-loop ATPase